MKVNSEIFRAYDIRGIAGKELTEEGIFYILVPLFCLREENLF